MTNQSSITYISSLLNNPGGMTEGDHSSISLFRQTFPYFVPVRYFGALEAHKKKANSPQMLSAIRPYLGDWIMFCDFLDAGTKKFADVPRVVDKKKVDIAKASAEEVIAATVPAAEAASPAAAMAEAVSPPPVVLHQEAPATASQPEVPEIPVVQAPVVAQDVSTQAGLSQIIGAALSASPGGPVIPEIETPVPAVPNEVKPFEELIPPLSQVTAIDVTPEPLFEASLSPEVTAGIPVSQIPATPITEVENAAVAAMFSPVVPVPVVVSDLPMIATELTGADLPLPAEAVEDAIPVAADEPPTPLAERTTVHPVQHAEPQTAPMMPEQVAGIQEAAMDVPGDAVPGPVVPAVPESIIEPVIESVPATEEVALQPEIAAATERQPAETPAFAPPGMDLNRDTDMAEPVSAFGSAFAEALAAREAEMTDEPQQKDAAEIPQASSEPVKDTQAATNDGIEIINETGQEGNAEHATRYSDPLIFPIYTRDYFLQQGEKVSDEIPLEINELKDFDWRTEKDKSLMVVMSFSEWLLHFKNTAEKQKEESKDQKALKTMWQKEKLAAAIEEENEEIPENVFEMAVNSISKDDVLESETLADIYIKQGKYDKAIEVYRKLSLRNPQKNAYFARKIEEALKDKQS